MLAFDRSGSGVPLVFLHAFPLSRTMWDVNRSAFDRHFQTIAVDLPGFGESGLPEPGLTMEEMARQVAQTLEAAGITDKFVLTGLSMGGYVAFPFWKMFADRVRALVLVSARSAPDSAEARDKRFQNIALVEKSGVGPLAERMLPALLGKTSRESHPALVENVRSMIERQSPSGVCAALQAMAARPDSTPLLSTVSVPALVLAGEEDTVIPVAEMKGMAENLPRPEFHAVRGAGHLLSMEKPGEFHDLFLQFLKRRVL